MVECKTCNKVFEAVDPATDEGNGREGFQAIGCAAQAIGLTVMAYYGSEYDLNIYQFINRPIYVRDGNICDGCMTRLMACGELVFVQEVTP